MTIAEAGGALVIQTETASGNSWAGSDYGEIDVEDVMVTALVLDPGEGSPHQVFLEAQEDGADYVGVTYDPGRLCAYMSTAGDYEEACTPVTEPTGPFFLHARFDGNGVSPALSLDGRALTLGSSVTRSTATLSTPRFLVGAGTTAAAPPDVIAIGHVDVRPLACP
jgi:hypothetical protein